MSSIFDWHKGAAGYLERASFSTMLGGRSTPAQLARGKVAADYLERASFSTMLGSIFDWHKGAAGYLERVSFSTMLGGRSTPAQLARGEGAADYLERASFSTRDVSRAPALPVPIPLPATDY